MTDINAIDLNAMDSDALAAHAKRVNDALAHRQNAGRKDAVAKVTEYAKTLGYRIGELFPGAVPARTGAPRKSTSTVAPKFRSPHDANVTWGGKGNRPQWFRDALAAGHTEQSMLIAAGVQQQVQAAQEGKLDEGTAEAQLNAPSVDAVLAEGGPTG